MWLAALLVGIPREGRRCCMRMSTTSRESFTSSALSGRRQVMSLLLVLVVALAGCDTPTSPTDDDDRSGDGGSLRDGQSYHAPWMDWNCDVTMVDKGHIGEVNPYEYDLDFLTVWAEFTQRCYSDYELTTVYAVCTFRSDWGQTEHCELTTWLDHDGHTRRGSDNIPIHEVQGRGTGWEVDIVWKPCPYEQPYDQCPKPEFP